jgi:hypothetical protein
MKLSLVISSAALAAGVFGCSDTLDEPGGSDTGTGGLGASGGGSGTSTGGTGGGVAGAATGGAVSTGGALATGGAVATGGTANTGGSSIIGGAANTGGANATGGTANPGGASATGGTGNTGGANATGGTAGTGGAGATGGKAGTGGTAGGASCDASWNPPATANGNTGIPAGLDKEWARSGPTTLRSNNTKIHQMMENGGKMRYCARWDSSSPISAEERQQAAALMSKCDQQWTDKLTGWGCWPYSTIDVKIVMWVVRDAALLTGWNASEGSYVIGTPTTNDATDMACPRDCAQLPNQPQKTSCTGGQVYDEFLWLDGDKTDYTGWGWVDGYYMAASHFMTAAKRNAATETIVAHELGHAHTLNDFYNAGEVPAGWTSFVMKAGSSSVVTDTDGWMLRNVWRHVRSQWGYPPAQ